jgi:opacity protein-like surface antigen
MRSTCLIALAVVLSMPPTAAAEDPPVPAAQVVQRNPPPDFLFNRPHTSIGVRGSYTFARAGSDWYDFVTDQLTLDKHDFSSGGIVADVGINITRRLEVVFGADYASTTSGSEFRDFVDNLRLPINQTTNLRQSTLTGGVRFALTERGRELSSLAWVPRRFVPYVGAGGGALWYRVQQTGDFVDFQDFSIFTDQLESSGWAPAAYVSGGGDVQLHRHLFITVDARYLWATKELERPWTGFDDLDLAGLRLSTGLNVIF